MHLETLIAGFGGQGILLMGQLLAEAAMDEGLHATWFPSYGPEMRGGTANCATIISDDEIGSPISLKYDVVIVMNQPSLERFAPMVRPGGLLLVNSDLVSACGERTDVETLLVPAGRLAREGGIERAANVVMLGALLAARPAIRFEAVEGVIERRIGRKRPEQFQANVAALHLGEAHVQRARAPVG